jgi:hypothetical protein
MHRATRLGMVSAVGLLVAAPALASPPVVHPPNLRAGPATSLNWSGYAVTGNDVTDVKASWIVPAVTCAPGEFSYSAFWTGIDGFTSRTVEQIGTSSDCFNGTPVYSAWYEFYPSPSKTIALSVNPGDWVFAGVSYDAASRSFTVWITDLTTEQHFTKSKKMPRAERSSAEWIAEAPSAGSFILPLANFGTAYFGDDYTVGRFTDVFCSATVDGTTGAIGAFGTAIQQITMVDSGGGVRASPSALSADGSSFTVTWEAP